MLWFFWLACTPRDPIPPDLPVHHLAFGGDLCAGKELNQAIHHPAASQRIFASAPPILKEADLTLVNLEGVISGGGWMADRGESRPILYRARPELAGLMADAGIDVVTVANNHGGDYGPDALHETVDTLAIAGIDTVGGGANLEAAMSPVYRQVGDTVVAFVGADLTGTKAWSATDTRPGIWVVPPQRAAEILGPLVPEARRHADVVVLTVHWGENFAREPSEATRQAAKELIDAGYDAILGHSAHVMQGMEIFDGRPVLYDAGNFLTGHRGRKDQEYGIVYDLAFTKAGVVSVQPHAIRLDAGRVVKAPDEALKPWRERSEALGTEVVDGRVVCTPTELRPRSEQGPPPRRPVPDPPFLAPRDVWVDGLRPFATPLEATFANGMTLLGYRMVAPELRQPKAGQVVDLYFRIDAPQSADLRIEVRGDAARRDRSLHLPADWSLGGDELVVGRILHDRSLVRIRQPTEGSMTFSVALYDGKQRIDVEAPRLHDGGVWLGSIPFTPDAKRVYEYPGMEPPTP